jgi:hypothetical protein
MTAEHIDKAPASRSELSSPPICLDCPRGSVQAMVDDHPNWFLAQAEQCERRADKVDDDSVRSLYRLLARQWRQFAERAASKQAV